MDNGYDNGTTDNPGNSGLPDIFGIPSDTPGLTEDSFVREYTQELEGPDGDSLGEHVVTAHMTFRSIPLDRMLDATLNHITENADR